MSPRRMRPKPRRLWDDDEEFKEPSFGEREWDTIDYIPEDYD